MVPGTPCSAAADLGVSAWLTSFPSFPFQAASYFLVQGWAPARLSQAGGWDFLPTSWPGAALPKRGHSEPVRAGQSHSLGFALQVGGKECHFHAQVC